MAINQLDIESLREFQPLSKLSEQQLILLASNHLIKEYKTKQVIIEAGSSDNMEYFLIKGKLELTARDGKKMVIDGHHSAAKNAIAHLQPRQYQVKALEPTQMLLVDWSILAQFVREAPRAASGGNDGATEFDNPKALLLENFRQDLANNTLVLPSLPDLAIRINELIKDDDCSVKEVAKMVAKDPAMAVKIISAANSPLFRGLSSITTCEDAISRLGLQTTQRLVRIYSLRELFKSTHKTIQTKMQQLWVHSEEVAAIAAVLARHVKGVSSDQAMLAGLIHDVGAIPLYSYIESQEFLFKSADIVDSVVNELKAEVGTLLLQKWHWPEELVAVAAHCEDWEYQSEVDQADCVDLVILSQLHAAIGKPEFKHFPMLNKVSSFARLGSFELTPDKSIKIIREAQADIDEARNLLKVGA